MGGELRKVTSEKYALKALFATQATLQYTSTLTQKSSCFALSIYSVTSLQFWTLLLVYFITLDALYCEYFM